MVKNLPATAEDVGLIPGSGSSPKKEMATHSSLFFFFFWLTSVFLRGEFYGQRSLVDYSSWGDKELDMIKQLTLSLFTFKMGKIPTWKV